VKNAEGDDMADSVREVELLDEWEIMVVMRKPAA
jgi:hypothetical protein